MGLRIKVLPAHCGDSILLSFDKHNILIDGGFSLPSYAALRREVLQIKQQGELLDLVIITHIDEDHIKGIIHLFEDSSIPKEGLIKEFIFNSSKLIASYFNEKHDQEREIPIRVRNSKEMGYKDGETLEKYLMKQDFWYAQAIVRPMQFEVGEAVLTVLSPDEETLLRLQKKWEFEVNKQGLEISGTKNDYNVPFEKLVDNKFVEDRSLPNRSSIAFLLEYQKLKILMLGDSHPSVVIKTLRNLGYSESNPLRLDVVKVSHHGSKGNTSEELLNIIEVRNFIISTNGRHCLPDKECLCKIMLQKPGAKFYFNYPEIGKLLAQSDLKGTEFMWENLRENKYILEV